MGSLTSCPSTASTRVRRAAHPGLQGTVVRVDDAHADGLAGGGVHALGSRAAGDGPIAVVRVHGRTNSLGAPSLLRTFLGCDDERAEHAAPDLVVRDLVRVIPVGAGVGRRRTDRRTLPPTGTASWVTPATPSSAFGTSMPCQCRATPSGTSLLRSVTCTRSPCVASISGSGRRPVEGVAVDLLPRGEPEGPLSRRQRDRHVRRPGLRPVSVATLDPVVDMSMPAMCGLPGPPPRST